MLVSGAAMAVQIQLVWNITTNKLLNQIILVIISWCLERKGNLRAHEEATDEGREGSHLIQKTQRKNLQLKPHTFFSHSWISNWLRRLYRFLYVHRTLQRSLSHAHDMAKVYRHKLAAEHFDTYVIICVVEDTVRIRACFFTALAGPAGLTE